MVCFLLFIVDLTPIWSTYGGSSFSDDQVKHIKSKATIQQSMHKKKDGSHSIHHE
jgi:hypothetical protein